MLVRIPICRELGVLMANALGLARPLLHADMQEGSAAAAAEQEHLKMEHLDAVQSPAAPPSHCQDFSVVGAVV